MMSNRNRALEEYCRINNIELAAENRNEIVSPNEGLEKLRNLKGILIKQSFQPIEFITGFQQENTYEVFGFDEHGTDFLLLNRRFQCTFFCYNRPRLDVILQNDGQRDYLGYVLFPCKCSCEYTLEIYGRNRKLKYIIVGSCCQMGIICRACPCEDCQSAVFSILDGETKKEITKIKKKTPGFWKAAFSEADNFSVMFPQNINVEDKALIMASTIFMDFNYFESKTSRK